MSVYRYFSVPIITDHKGRGIGPQQSRGKIRLGDILNKLVDIWNMWVVDVLSTRKCCPIDGFSQFTLNGKPTSNFNAKCR